MEAYYPSSPDLPVDLRSPRGEAMEGCFLHILKKLEESVAEGRRMALGLKPQAKRSITNSLQELRRAGHVTNEALRLARGFTSAKGHTWTALSQEEAA